MYYVLYSLKKKKSFVARPQKLSDKYKIVVKTSTEQTNE